MLLCALLLAIPACAQPTAPSEAASPPDTLQIVERVSPHVYVLRLPAPNFMDPVGNVAVIEQSDGLILVDSGRAFGSGRRVVKLVKSISAKPVKAIVLTHYHSDHSLGVPAILAAWPKADLIAHIGTARAMAEGRPPRVPRARSAAYEETAASRSKESFAAQAKEVAKLESPWERAGWARELAILPQWLADLPGTYVVLPRRTFTERLDLPDPVTPVQILFLGRANTPGDAMVWMPSEGILATGDVVVAPVPFMFEVYPAEMLQVFDRIKALGPKLLIPGHGVPQGPAYLGRLSDFVRDVRSQVVPMTARKVPLDQIQAKIEAGTYRDAFAGKDQWIRFWFDNYALAPLVESIYREAKGEPLGPPPVPKPAPPADTP